MYTADALSQAPTGVPVDSCIEFQKEVESHIAAVTETLPATKQQLDKYRHAQAARVCNRLSGYSGYSDIRKNLSVRIAT